MTRYDDNTYDADLSGRQALAFASDPDCSDYLTTIHDIEVGYRAADFSYMLEALDDITYWADLARVRALDADLRAGNR